MANITDIVGKVRTAEPRIDTLPEYSRIAVAGMMYAGMSFEDASAAFTQTIQAATIEVKNARETQKAWREATLSTFEKAVFQPVFDAAASIELDKRPKGGLVLTVFYDEPQKNSDGSPKLDESNNPVTGIGVHASAKWTERGSANSTASNSNGASGRGRVGKVLYNGTEFGSLKEMAKSANVSTDGNVRDNLVAAGYTVGNRETGSDGKSFLTVSRATASNGVA